MKAIRHLICTIRRSHPWTCNIRVHPAINLEEHTHICSRCDHVLLNELKSINPAIFMN